ncbi:NERD domain-containing protein [Bradyrhizobium sp. 200]|uniref:hypothetical protein n=1 Tax=Bradyrhizobium sp. 200 TaxID=2782665 RepID=UPI001FFFC407|nr:hypothetical protein [Bradyrhizobium sp. 200]UPJ48487.1 NERD domain-containing protein [Bradyrhizobium sp. 200]
MSTSDNGVRLSEAAVKGALETISWNSLRRHLDEIIFDSAAFGEVLDHIRRHSKFIAKYPAADLERRRDAFLDSLEQYVLDTLGAEEQTDVQKYRELLNLIESGYQGILEMLDRSEVSKFAPARRLSAYIAGAAKEHSYVMNKANQAAMRDGGLDVNRATLLQGDAGNSYSPGAVLGAIVMALGATLGMEAHRNKWWHSDGRLVLPPLEQVSDGDIEKAAVGSALGMIWRRWERAEEKHRFLGNELRELDASEWPEQAPAHISRFLVSRSGELDLLDVVANERLDDRFTQDFMHLITHTRISEQVVGIDDKASLPPTKYISIEEAHAAYSLSRILSFDVLSDVQDRGGLTLREWIRGYSVLKAMAEDLFDEAKPDVVRVRDSELEHTLVRMGLVQSRARLFIDRVTFSRPTKTAKASRDLYDCPLVATQDGSFVLVAPALLASHVAMLTISNISRFGEDFLRKGKAFENAVQELFRKHGLPCHSFKHDNGNERYEFDAIVPWGDYLFLFECKNHGLSGYDPVRAYHFASGLVGDMKQARRQADELRRNSELIATKLGKEWVNKKVIATVLNCLPYSIPVDQNSDIHVCDFSVLSRFFDSRHLYTNERHPLGNNASVLHRTAVSSQWSGDQPAPDDLLETLRSPSQFKIVADHLIMNQSDFPIADDTIVLSFERLRTNTTEESFAKAAGGDPRKVRKTIDRFSTAVKRAKSDLSKRRVREQDRLWRELQKRNKKT